MYFTKQISSSAGGPDSSMKISTVIMLYNEEAVTEIMKSSS